MLVLIIIFALIHSGGAALRPQAENLIGPRAWRLIFASASIPSAFVLIWFFLAHRYDGLLLWNLQGVPQIKTLIWIISAMSFLFLYPATYNLLEIPAVKKPQLKLYSSGIIRVSRHPQAIGQILWCIAHSIWIGTSFMLITSVGLIAHHLFAIWHGDQRLQKKFGTKFLEIKKNTSIIPFLAVLDGRQKLVFKEFLKPSQVGILIAISLFWWSHRFIPIATQLFFSSQLTELLR